MKIFSLFCRDRSDPFAPGSRSMILQILFCLVCGVLLIAFDQLALLITAYVLAGVMILCSIWSVIAYIRSSPAKRIIESRLASGLILLIAGAILAFNPDYLKDSLSFIWGLALLFGGFLKIQYAFDEKTVHVQKWWIMLIFAGFSLIIGILSLLNPDFLGKSHYLVIGILLVLEAVLNITVCFLLKHALKKNSGGSTPADMPSEIPASADHLPDSESNIPSREAPASETTSPDSLASEPRI